MTLISRTMNLARRVANVYHHAGSGDNLSLSRLASRALPYYVNPDGTARPPVTIFLSVNGICQFKCKMCDIGQKNTETSFYKNLNPDPGSELSVERLRELFEEVKSFKPLIAITTTEPLLYKPLDKVVGMATEMGLETLVTTNGYNLEKRAESLFHAGLKHLNVSLDGPPELHDEIRGIPRSFSKAVAGFKVLDELKKRHGTAYPKLKVNTVVSNHNFFALSDFADAIAELPIQGVTISHMNFVTENMANEHNRQFLDVGKATKMCLESGTDSFGVDVKRLWQEIEKVKDKHGKKIQFSPDFNQKELYKFFHEPEEVVWDNKCLIPWFVTEILANGDIIPMTRCFQVLLGNIYNDSFMNIWNGEPIKKFRRSLMEHQTFPACTRCRGIL